MNPMSPMNPYGGMNYNDPNFQKMWNIFQQIHQQQMQQILLNQQFFVQYFQFCLENGLNPNDQCTFFLFKVHNNLHFHTNPHYFHLNPQHFHLFLFQVVVLVVEMYMSMKEIK